MERPANTDLGAASPHSAPTMVENSLGYPASCIRCGDSKERDAFMCLDCSCLTSAREFAALHNDWETGKRDFPRSPVVVPTADTQKALSAPSAHPAGSVEVGQRRRWVRNHGDFVVGERRKDGLFKCEFYTGPHVGSDDYWNSSGNILDRSTLLSPSPNTQDTRTLREAPSKPGCSERSTAYGLPCTNHTPDYHEHTASGARWPVVVKVRLQPAESICSFKRERQQYPGVGPSEVCARTVAHSQAQYCELHIHELMVKADEKSAAKSGSEQIRGSCIPILAGGLFDIRRGW